MMSQYKWTQEYLRFLDRLEALETISLFPNIIKLFVGRSKLFLVHFTFLVEIDTLEYSRVKATSVSVRLRIFLFALINTNRGEECWRPQSDP
jgi:hypothetical protein